MGIVKMRILTLLTAFIGAAVAEPLAEITEKVYFDITIDDEPAGQIVFGLFGNIVPKTVKNFATLCDGSAGVGNAGKALHFQGSSFHGIIPGFMAQGGTSPMETELAVNRSTVTNSMTKTSTSSTQSHTFSPWQTLDQTQTDPSSSSLSRKPHGLTEDTPFSAKFSKELMLSLHSKRLDLAVAPPRRKLQLLSVEELIEQI